MLFAAALCQYDPVDGPLLHFLQSDDTICLFLIQHLRIASQYPGFHVCTMSGTYLHSTICDLGNN